MGVNGTNLPGRGLGLVGQGFGVLQQFGQQRQLEVALVQRKVLQTGVRRRDETGAVDKEVERGDADETISLVTEGSFK